MSYYRKPVALDVVIANGATDSDEIRIGDYVITGIRIPAAITSATLTFEGAGQNGGTYAPIYDSDGNQVSVAIAVSRSIGLSAAELDAVSAWPWIKIIMGSAEGAARTLELVKK
jgi:hypothetical protein